MTQLGVQAASRLNRAHGEAGELEAMITSADSSSSSC
jgi:hypothetical protein